MQCSQACTACAQQEETLEKQVAMLFVPFVRNYKSFCARGTAILRLIIKQVHMKFDSHVVDEMAKLENTYPQDWRSFCLAPRDEERIRKEVL